MKAPPDAIPHTYQLPLAIPFTPQQMYLRSKNPFVPTYPATNTYVHQVLYRPGNPVDPTIAHHLPNTHATIPQLDSPGL